jgi:hypothetical protein
MEMGSGSKNMGKSGRVARGIDIAKTLFHRARRARRIAASTDPRVQEVLDALRRQGYFVVENFYDRARCAELLGEMDRLFHEYEPLLVNDDLKSDTRAYAAERVSEPIRRFAEDPLITAVMRCYMGNDHQCFFTMANRVRPVPGNLGSGGGWHRDTIHERQFKAILYLADVGPRGGPFTFLPGSHRVGFIAKTIARCGMRYGQYQYSSEEFARISQCADAQPVSITAPAGTLIFAETSAIHRGMPIEEGARYAMTNYCYDPATIETFKRRGKFTGYFLDQAPKAADVKA